MKKIDVMDEIVSELTELRKQDRQLSPQEKQDKTKSDLAQLSVNGRHAMELEGSKAFKEFIEPAIREKLKCNMKIIMIEGLRLSELELKVLIAEMQEALGPYTMIRKAKQEALTANKSLDAFQERDNKQNQRKKENADKERRIHSVIKRKEKAEAARVKKESETK